jgi:hypothetical protein
MPSSDTPMHEHGPFPGSTLTSPYMDLKARLERAEAENERLRDEYEDLRRSVLDMCACIDAAGEGADLPMDNDAVADYFCAVSKNIGVARVVICGGVENEDYYEARYAYYRAESARVAAIRAALAGEKAPAEAPPCMCSFKANPSTWRLCPLHDPPAEAPAGERQCAECDAPLAPGAACVACLDAGDDD